MRRLGWLAFTVALIAMVAGSMLYGQARSGRTGEGRRPGGRTDAGAFDRVRTQTMLQLLGLSEQEVAAALKAAEAKGKARQVLEEERGKLRLTGDAPGATDQQLSQAIAAYTKAMGTYRATVESEDSTLVKQLSVKSRARCLAAGILDNGLGFGGRARSAGRGGEGAGSGGGRRGGPIE